MDHLTTEYFNVPKAESFLEGVPNEGLLGCSPSTQASPPSFLVVPAAAAGVIWASCCLGQRSDRVMGMVCVIAPQEKVWVGSKQTTVDTHTAQGHGHSPCQLWDGCMTHITSPLGTLRGDPVKKTQADTNRVRRIQGIPTGTQRVPVNASRSATRQ